MSGVRLLLAVDDGAHWLDRDTSRRLPKLVDGNEKTSEALLADAAPLGLRRAVSLERGSETVTLQVAFRDWGIGIAPELQRRIFSRFSQDSASATLRFEQADTGGRSTARSCHSSML